MLSWMCEVCYVLGQPERMSSLQGNSKKMSQRPERGPGQGPQSGRRALHCVSVGFSLATQALPFSLMFVTYLVLF